MLKELGLPYLTWHHLRYNAGSYLLSENVPIPAISKILGHANPAITIYDLDLDGLRRLFSRFIHLSLNS